MIFELNVSILFTELPYLDRFAAARAAGFEAVESWWPTGEDPDRVVEAVRESDLRLVGLNFDGGDMAAGDRGLVSDPDRAAQFRENVPIALDIAARLGCTRLNALLGTERPGLERSRQLALAAENVRWAAEQGEPQGATVLVEPVNRKENGPYLLDTTDRVAAFLVELGRPNVRMLFDCYHAQRGEGDVANALERHFGLIGHVQIADSPHRNEPGSGEINYRYLLGVLRRLGYDGYVGLEYKPRGGTEESLGWLPRTERAGSFDLDAVFERPRAEVAR